MTKRAHEIKTGDTIVIKLSKESFPTEKENIDILAYSKKMLRSLDKEIEKGIMVLHFEVDDITMEYINDEVSKLYGEEDEPLPEHTKYTFHHEDLGMFEIRDRSGSTYLWEVE